MPCSPKMAKCRPDCLHRAKVHTYYGMAEATPQQLNQRDIDTQDGIRRSRRSGVLPFKDFLIDTAQPAEPPAVDHDEETMAA